MSVLITVKAILKNDKLVYLFICSNYYELDVIALIDIFIDIVQSSNK